MAEWTRIATSTWATDLKRDRVLRVGAMLSAGWEWAVLTRNSDGYLDIVHEGTCDTREEAMRAAEAA